MRPRTTRFLGFTAAAALALLLVPEIGRAQVVVKVNDVVNFRMGFQLQGWSEWLQDQVTDGYEQNFKIRRVRFILAGNLARDVSFFFQTDNPNMGQSTGTSVKAINTGFLVQDAFGEWKPIHNDMFIIDFGKMLMPFTRNSLQQTSSHLALDGGTWTFLQSAPEQGDAGRDIGLQLKHYLLNDHLELRYGLFDGFRAPNATGTTNTGSRNPFRFVGRVVYNFADTEKGYVPVGTNLGKKRIIAIGGGYDTQGGYTTPNPSAPTAPVGHGYKAYGFDGMIDLPFGPGDAATGRDALTAHVDYINYDGGCRPNAAGVVQTNCLISTLPREDEIFTDIGWYFHTINLQPFLRYETLMFKDTANFSKGIRRYMGGFNYYVTPASQNLKLTAAWEKIVPKTQPAGSATKNTNHFVVQLQFYYF